MTEDELTIVLPEVSKDQVSSDLRALTAILDQRDPEMTAHGILGGEHGYGSEFSSDVFEMHPFWWGDCTCGHEDRERAWERNNRHAPDCYQSRIDWDAPRDQVEAQVARVCAEMNLDPDFGSWVHCTCYMEAARRARMDANPHPGDCPVMRPNFRHHASGFEVRWYKYIGRGMEHEPIGRGQWAAIIRQCIQSVSERSKAMTDEELIEKIADEISGISVGEGYYSQTIGISAALEAAKAIAPLLNRVREEAIREFQVNDLRDRAEQADAQWRAWGDVNDCELRDLLLDRADAIEQNSEGNET